MKRPYLGIGLGLRRQHFDDALNLDHQIDWFELLSENFMNYGGRPRDTITKLKKLGKPMVCHGVGLSLGSTDELDQEYMEHLQELLNFIKAPWFSDHLSFCSQNKVHYHDLIPILRTQESLEFIADRIKRVQDYFERPFAIENVSMYVESSHNKIPEVDFINALVEKTNCLLLLDVNNVYVNAKNLNVEPFDYIKNLPLENVIQIHLAGHWDRGDVLIDTHGDHVNESVWQLYRYALKQIGTPISTMIEWDNDVPEFEVLEQEALKAKDIMNQIFFDKEQVSEARNL